MQKGSTKYSALEELLALLVRPACGLRLVSSLASLFGAWLLLRNPMLFENSTIYAPLGGLLPEWAFSVLGVILALLLALSPRARARQAVWLASFFWWLFWALLLSGTDDTPIGAGACIALTLMSVLEFVRCKIPPPRWMRS